MTPGAQRSTRVLRFALIDPGVMWIRQDERHRVLELARHELRVEQRKLLVEQVGPRGRVARETQRCRRETVEESLGRDILNVTKHVAIFSLCIELRRPNLDFRPTRSAAGRVVHANDDPPHELAWSDATSTATQVVEAEELARWLDREGVGGGPHVDLEAIVATLGEYGTTRLGMP
jgi:hypothetical protein